ncbi:MAG TPA: helix-turn-helix transcriptional regulator [Pseudonocardiaceae bacterium]|jgi:DNA-binding CsgD family transcriptional regulator
MKLDHDAKPRLFPMPRRQREFSIRIGWVATEGGATSVTLDVEGDDGALNDVLGGQRPGQVKRSAITEGLAALQAAAELLAAAFVNDHNPDDDPHDPAAALTNSYSAKRVRLTKREREIAGLVGRGYTNLEIGEKLHVTPKTVEYHLGHVYTKLAIVNRRQLRDMIQTRTMPAVPLPRTTGTTVTQLRAAA